MQSVKMKCANDLGLGITQNFTSDGTKCHLWSEAALPFAYDLGQPDKLLHR